MATVLLPGFFVMQDYNLGPNGPYMCLVKVPPVNQPSGFLNFSESQIWSPLVKFAAEISETGDRELVHIRSCYNNKYLVVSDDGGRQNMIVASADKPEEDRTNPACTLFLASGITSSTMQLYYFGKSMYVVPGGDTIGMILNCFSHRYIITDWETLAILPSQVTFRSEDLDGNYMCSRVIERLNYHRFESELDVGDPLVAHELFPTANGNYRIKNMHFGKFWRRNNSWIWADAEDNNNSNDTLFSFVKISDNVFALRNLGNDRFCGGLTAVGKTDCLSAQYPSIARHTRPVVEERVLSREISDVVYRLSDSRIYQEEIQEVSHAFATNDSADQDHEVTLSYSSSDSMTTYWGNTVLMKIGTSLEFKTTIIPFISKATVTFTTDVGYTREWGEEKNNRAYERSHLHRRGATIN